jgi:tetratricopeptide (TPR) repeat protein
VNGFQAAAHSVPVARLARGLIMTALQQSSKVSTVTDQDLLPALRRLQPDAQLPVQGEPLRKLLQLNRAHYWMEGTLSELNGRPSLSVRLLRASDQRLTTEEEFRDKPSVTTLAAETALWVRKLAGESKESLALNSVYVTRYTTGVPEALQKYYDAMEYYSAGEWRSAIPLIDEALRLDPDFAQAHFLKSAALYNDRRYTEALAESEQSMRLSTKLPERERAGIETFYQGLVHDPARMVDVARRNCDFHPDEPRFYRILAQLLAWNGRSGEALEHLEKALSLAPENGLLRNELILTLSQAGQADNALRLYDEARAKPASTAYLDQGGGIACLCLGRYAEAERLFGRIPEDTEFLLPGAMVMRGNFDSAVVLLKQEISRQQVQQVQAQEHLARQLLCGTEYLADRVNVAREDVRRLVPLPDCPAFGAHLQFAASWAARLGEWAVLDAAADQLRRIAIRWPNGYTQAVSAHANALHAWGAGALAKAEELLLTSLGAAFTLWTLFDLSEFYTATSRWDLAEEYWLKFESHHARVFMTTFMGAAFLGWLSRGSAAKARGDWQTANACATRILEPLAGHNPKLRIVRLAQRLTLNQKQS